MGHLLKVSLVVLLLAGFCCTVAGKTTVTYAIFDYKTKILTVGLQTDVNITGTIKGTANGAMCDYEVFDDRCATHNKVLLTKLKGCNVQLLKKVTFEMPGEGIVTVPRKSIINANKYRKRW